MAKFFTIISRMDYTCSINFLDNRCLDVMTNRFSEQQHSFHLVTLSPWPITAAIGVGSMAFGAVMYFHFFRFGGFTLLLGLILLAFSIILWWRDVIREGTFEGMHTGNVQRGLRIGMILFIVSEIMFF